MKLSDTIVTNIADISQVNMEELIRDVEEEEANKLLKQVMENNVMILKLQKIIVGVTRSRKAKKKRK